MDKISEIVFLGELLRTQEINAHYSDKNTRFLYELFRGQIEAATGLVPDFELSREPKRFDRDRFYALAGHGEPSTEGWIRIASGEYDPKASAYFAECFENALIIGHEAGSLVGVMERENVPFIDLRVSPIRFLDDILFALRSNIPGVSERLREFLYPDDAIRFAANQLKAHYVVRTPDAQVLRRTATAGFPPGSLLLCGQTDMDLSLIRNGRVENLLDHAGEAERLFAEHEHVFYKKHPVAAQAAGNARFLDRHPKIRPVSGNIYRMLSDDNLVTVAALSSGVLHEAPYFGKRSAPLSHRYIELASGSRPAAADDYIMTRDEYFFPEFWRRILSPAVAVRECGPSGTANRVNFLRSRLGMWWGYELGRDGEGGGASPPLSLCRRLVNAVDPRCRLRNRLDPSGKARRAVKRFLGEG